MNNLLGFIFGGDADDRFFPTAENGVTLVELHILISLFSSFYL